MDLGLHTAAVIFITLDSSKLKFIQHWSLSYDNPTFLGLGLHTTRGRCIILAAWETEILTNVAKLMIPHTMWNTSVVRLFIHAAIFKILKQSWTLQWTQIQTRLQPYSWRSCCHPHNWRINKTAWKWGKTNWTCDWRHTHTKPWHTKEKTKKHLCTAMNHSWDFWGWKLQYKVTDLVEEQPVSGCLGGRSLVLMQMLVGCKNEVVVIIKRKRITWYAVLPCLGANTIESMYVSPLGTWQMNASTRKCRRKRWIHKIIMQTFVIVGKWRKPTNRRLGKVKRKEKKTASIE